MSDLPKEILDKAQNIKLLVLDVDGVLSDGKLYFSDKGDEFKAFSTLDGQGIKLLQNAGIEVALITGRTSSIVTQRAKELGIKTLVQGCEAKLTALDDILEKSNLRYHEVAYMGDDLPDLACIRRVGFGITVPNANPVILQHALCCTERPGGQGAVREICDLILQAQNKFDAAIAPFM
ncbi:3-deoxy-manno-octulosonate-8-phosphatase KdsC [Haliea sp. AH-315-K21]|uniref:3-deoxy-D-manno-octulosonate 8-phosphate phosphatase KdsC n=1 Tax=SAR86 cluster bacterium TaxID=2030880 RepID=A0A2A5CA44_9GAMM|nr:3-deoxy-manno-octulosonate-8-phosphatase KdsC [Haliea sp. AH-315-K21]PCJ40623.1 MAG: 3-deoxy-manno-octulosonate-8-phosphatase KdsC [SAR86 cluster bacterium]